MKNIKLIFILLFTLSLFSCNKDEDLTNINNYIEIDGTTHQLSKASYYKQADYYDQLHIEGGDKKLSIVFFDNDLSMDKHVTNGEILVSKNNCSVILDCEYGKYENNDGWMQIKKKDDVYTIYLRDLCLPPQDNKIKGIGDPITISKLSYTGKINIR